MFHQVAIAIYDGNHQCPQDVSICIFRGEEPKLRVLCREVIPSVTTADFEMKMAADRPSGPADFADLISGRNFLIHVDIDPGKMSI